MANNLDSDNKKLSLAWGRLVTPEQVQAAATKKQGWLQPKSLTIKILGINILPLILMIFSLAIFGEYRTVLIESELQLLESETRLYTTLAAKSFAEQPAVPAASSDDTQPETILETAPKNPSFEDLFPAKRGLHVAVSGIDGEVLFDSRPFWPANSDNAERTNIVERTLYDLFSRSAISYDLPVYPSQQGTLDANSQDFQAALLGDVSYAAWQGQDGELFLTSTAPIYYNNKLVGILEIGKSDTRISETFSDIHRDVFRILFTFLILTIITSLYLTAFIAHPLKRLARVAENIRTGKDQNTDVISDLSRRTDEVGDLARAISLMINALTERLSLSERFAADVAHELKNPLTSMRSAFETFNLVKEQKKKNALKDIILQDFERVDRLITDISKMTRLDTELARDAFHSIYIVPFIENICAFYLPMSHPDDKRQRHVPVTLSLTCDRRVVIRGQEDRLAQVFFNLLDNAQSFSPEGGSIRVHVLAQEKWVRITVEDDGPGIPDGKLETIFERFYTERPSKEEYGHHSGLGLAIGQQIMKAHRGRMWAENRREQQSGKIIGARLVVHLPRAEDETGRG